MRDIRKIKCYSKEILRHLLSVGVVYVAASSPYFTLNLMKNLSKMKISKKKLIPAFYYLKKRGLIEIRKEKHDVKIALTEEGKKRAGKYQIDDIKIERPKKWDKKYQLVIFDIPNTTRLVRDILRRKLKEWGFYPLQKSVWIHAFESKKEIELLREFLGLDKKQIRVLEVSKLENDNFLRKFFKLT